MARTGRHGAQGDGTAGSGRSRAVTVTAVRGLGRFAEARGVPAGREFLLDYDVIEAFCVTGLHGRASCTRGTYRSALYRLAGAHPTVSAMPAPRLITSHREEGRDGSQ